MAQQKIELRKIRDFGENISDTFQFIRQELKPLLGCFLAFSGVFIVAYGIFNGLYQSQVWSSMFDRSAIRVDETLSSHSRLSAMRQSFGFYYLMLFIFIVLNYSAMNTCLASYFKVYDAKGGVSPTIEEVWNQFKKYFFPVLLYSLLLALLILVGCLFCLVPGIYLAVVLAPFNMILIVEDFSFGQAFSKCFRIIKENFWVSLGIYFIAYLIYAMSGGIVGLMIGAVTGVGSYLTTKSVSHTAGIVTGILGIVTHVFYLIFFTSTALNYFSLTEQTDGDGLMKKIESMGQHNNNSSSDEQY